MDALTVLRLWELYREVTLGHGEERTCLSRLNSLSSMGSLAAWASGWVGLPFRKNKQEVQGNDHGGQTLPEAEPVLR